MIRIKIGQETIVFPTSGTDANWAAGVVSFAQAVSTRLVGIASQFDISPRVQVLASDSNTNLIVSDCIFPSGSVRGFAFNYSVYRTNGVTALAETGVVSGVFNSLTSSWGLEHEFSGPRQADGTPYHTFDMSGDQLVFSSIAIGGTYNNSLSKLSFAAKTILVSNL